MCKVYTGYCGTSEIEHGLCTCTVDNPLAKARGLSLRTGAQPMLYLPLIGFVTLLCNIYVRWGISFDGLAAVLQIIRGNRDNFGIIIHIFTVNIFCETVLMRGHNICFHSEIRKNIFELSSVPPVIRSSD